MTYHKIAAAACAGDEEAFFHFLSSHKKLLYSIAYSYMRNEADTLDMLQETAYKGWSKCSTLQDPSVLLNWLIRILIRCCIDELRLQKRRQQPLIRPANAYSPEMVSDDRMDMEMALSRLKPKYRQVIVLRYYNDMTIPEIARTLGRAEGTIKTWLYQGLKHLRGKIHYGGEVKYE